MHGTLKRKGASLTVLKVNMTAVIQVSAPGKVILHGEHAVVFGKSAVAASLNLRSHLELTVTNDGHVSLDLPAVGITGSWSVQAITRRVNLPIDVTDKTSEIPGEVLMNIKQLVDADDGSNKNLALTTFLFLYTAITGRTGNLPAVSVKIQSDIPIGAGLGSSAGLSVCLVTALLLQQGLITDPNQGPEGQGWLEKDLELINRWAFQGEKIIHGTPSGIDNSVATFGGAIKFQDGKITKLEKMPSLRILLTNTQVPRSTKVLVAGVREKFDKYQDIVQPVLESIEAVSNRCQTIYASLMSADNTESQYTSLEDLIDFNQRLLQVLGVSHVTIDTVCLVTSKYNLHSKLTGAGGGGCCITLLRPDTPVDVIDNIKAELNCDNSFSCWETNIGGPGVQVHKVTR